jgi:AraC-like DNA-binding protein
MAGTALTSGCATRQRSSASVFRFSTADFAPHDRLAAWREGVGGGVHLRLDVEPVQDAPPHATVELHRWPSASLYYSDISPVRASRTPALLQDGDGDFRLVRVEGSGFQFTAQGVDEVVGDGCAALLFNGVAGTVRYFAACRVTAIRLRRTDLAAALSGLDDCPIRGVAPGSPALRLLDSYTRRLRSDGPTADPELASCVGHHLTDLAALALGTTRDLAEIARLRGGRAARLREVKADIERRLGDENLSATNVAERHRVPVRYLQRLFEAEGVTFTEFVLARRLARAYRLLSDPRFIGQPIGIVAFESGFTNQTYFNRTFRRRYGAAPSDVRAQVRRDH